MDDILSERTLCWHGHVIRMDQQRIPQQALHWEVTGFKRGPGRPRINWSSIVNKDLSRIGLTWQEAEVVALNRPEWRWSVAQSIHFDAGWIKVKDQGLTYGNVFLQITSKQLIGITIDRSINQSNNQSIGIYFQQPRHTESNTPKDQRKRLHT